MTTRVFDFEVLSYIHPNGSLRKYGSLECQRYGCDYRIISPINRQDASAEKETYEELIAKLNQTRIKRIKTKEDTTLDEAFRIVFHLANSQEKQA
ncbi:MULTISPECIES: hypothetical protein [unclassified Roseofilum]|uniref:hypothetical protein n=1 Tax=unclassified Roseofilum TaxID=2620099 RepID=UPI000E8EC18D|nr:MULTISPECIES: hypothetical protein [unclassified Roseofilum]HBQ99891.1 hypothetical protein [Cyanobacteria bacterium UBA11691]MBP0007040.1 hypothetical protein [Roseofilum sp. Belize Diploria]MBP0013332.1 hypothetical protein [Roseofilum sp. SID3]MBP0023979.1 hypothetical protein [Roseofilum sp. SID2]MBP0031548.1 hypothetical protein [Roseofilum sp. Belize BBD 4]